MRARLLLSILCLGSAVALAETPAETGSTGSPSRSQMQEQGLERQLPGQQLRKLDIDGQSYLGLFMPGARPEPFGGVVLIADRNEHADWPQLIGPARRQLAEAGWHTLAIALPESLPAVPVTEDSSAADPVIDGNAEEDTDSQATESGVPAARQRINAAGLILDAEGAEGLILIGRGEGAYWALEAAIQAEDKPVALILFDARSPASAEQSLQTLLSQWAEPVYEVFSEQSDVATQRALNHRLQSRRLGQADYQQLILPQADFSELGQQMLIKRLEGWLQRLPRDQRNP